jgi:Ca2+-binding EF-hand superfamily protein
MRYSSLFRLGKDFTLVLHRFLVKNCKAIPINSSQYFADPYTCFSVVHGRRPIIARYAKSGRLQGAQKRKRRQTMVGSISSSSSLSQIAQAEMRQRMFNKIDANGDGKIGKDELTQMVAKGPQGGPSVDDIMSKLDTDGDSSISQSEFAAGDKANGQPPEGPPRMASGTGNISSADFVKQLLSDADTDSDGKISKDELSQVMANASGGGSSVDDIMSDLDTNGDGFISESELLAASQADQQAQSLQGESSVDDLFSALDTNGDGFISKSEFEASMANRSGSAQASNVGDDLAETLLEALENETKTASSTSGSGSQSSTSVMSIAAMLSNAIKTYMQSSSNSWSQTDVQGLLGAGLQV